jgi:hypothetical protein
VIASLIILGPVTLQQGHAQADSEACSLATLNGVYVFDATGYNIVSGSPPVPKTVVEFLTFKGDSSLTSIGTAVVNGSLLGTEFHPGTGTYTVNADCTGTLTFTGSPLGFDLYIASNGSRFHMIQVAPGGQMLAGPARRVSGLEGD